MKGIDTGETSRNINIGICRCSYCCCFCFGKETEEGAPNGFSSNAIAITRPEVGTNSSQNNNKSPNIADAAHWTGIVTRQIGAVGRMGLGLPMPNIYSINLPWTCTYIHEFIVADSTWGWRAAATDRETDTINIQVMFFGCVLVAELDKLWQWYVIR